MTQPEEQQNKGQQPTDEATMPVASTPPASGADHEPTAIVEPSSPAAPESPGAPPSPWGQPPAQSAAPQSPAAPGSPAALSPWTPPAGSAAPGSPVGQASSDQASPDQASAGQAPASPGQPGQPGAPLPPGWGQPQQPGQPAYQQPVDPFHTTTMTPTSAQLPFNPYAPGAAGDPNLPPGYTPDQMQMLQPPPKKKSRALLITFIVLGVVLLLCAVGGVSAFFLLNNSEGKGAESAKVAAQDFLTAVYKDHDGAAAEKLVCNEARDRKAIDTKIKEIEDQKAKLKGPSITWDSPQIENETAQQADTTVTVKLTTSDEKLSEQTIKLTLVKHDGWFVCEVQAQKK